MLLLFFLTLYGAWRALPSVYVVYFCCMDLYYYYKQRKKDTQIPHILIIFSIKNLVFFLTFSVLLADFHLLSFLSLVPPPTHPPTHLLSCYDKDRRFPCFLHPRAWMSLSAVIHGDHFSLSRLRTQCVTLESRRQPLTHSREFIFCLRGFSDELSSWKMFFFVCL